MTDRTPVAHPDTGEVLDDAGARELGLELSAVQSSIKEHLEEADRLGKTANQIRRALIDYVGEDNALPLTDWWTLTVLPGAPGRKSVNKDAAEAHREQLLSLGLGKVEEIFKPPTVADLNKRRAEVTAAGIPWKQIVTVGDAGPAHIEIVERETAT